MSVNVFGDIKLINTSQFNEFAKILVNMPTEIINIIYEYFCQPLILYYVDGNNFISRLTIIDDQRQDVKLAKFVHEHVNNMAKLQYFQGCLYIPYDVDCAPNNLSVYDISKDCFYAGNYFKEKFYIARDSVKRQTLVVNNDGIGILNKDFLVRKWILHHHGDYQHCLAVKDGIFLFQFKENLYKRKNPAIDYKSFNCAFFKFEDHSLTQIKSPPRSLNEDCWLFVLDDEHHHIALIDENAGYIYNKITNEYVTFDWEFPKQMNPRYFHINMMYHDDKIYVYTTLGPSFGGNLYFKQFDWRKILKSANLSIDATWSTPICIAPANSNFVQCLDYY